MKTTWPGKTKRLTVLSRKSLPILILQIKKEGEEEGKGWTEW